MDKDSPEGPLTEKEDYELSIRELLTIIKEKNELIMEYEKMSLAASTSLSVRGYEVPCDGDRKESTVSIDMEAER